MKHAKRIVGVGAALAIALAASPALASEGGIEILPQLFGLDGMLVLLVLFVALIFPVNKLIFRPIFKVLDEREERIDGARARAGEVSEQADGVLARYDEAVAGARTAAAEALKGRLSEARDSKKSATAAARSEAEAQMERARSEISTSLEAARSELRPRAEELAQAAAERVLGRAL